MTDHTKLAELLGSIGWNSPNDAQWERLQEAMPEIEALFEVPAKVKPRLKGLLEPAPGLSSPSPSRVQISIAVSLKRIADCFEEVLRRAPT